MILIDSIKKMAKMYKTSYWGNHVVVITISIMICLVFYLGYLPNITSDELILLSSRYIEILNATGILSTFFVLALDKVNFRKILEHGKKMVDVSKTHRVTEGSKITNTLFTFFGNDVLLVGIQYFLYIFGIRCYVLLIFNLMYMISSFIIVANAWHGIEITDLS